jgi:hypothetical protein
MGKVVPLMPSSVTFEQEIAALLRAHFPTGWIQHDLYVGEEQVDVLAVLPQGIFAIECKAYTGQILGDANGVWVAHERSKDIVIEPRKSNPYRQALRKALAVSDLLQGVLQANPQFATGERLWIHACVVFPQAAELSGLRRIPIDPGVVLPRGQGRAIVFHPARLSVYLENVEQELAQGPAQALVFALGGTPAGTWCEETVIPSPREPARRRWQLKIIWT